MMEKSEAILRLLELIKPGDTIYTVLRYVSRSGMKRVISLFVIKNNEPIRLDWFISKALGYRYNDVYEGIEVRGFGFDVGYAVVQNLSYRLFGEEGVLKHKWL
ncbi:MAG: hypothetical protein ABIM98_09150 [candidate division WOR-3 bacterium]